MEIVLHVKIKGMMEGRLHKQRQESPSQSTNKQTRAIPGVPSSCSRGRHQNQNFGSERVLLLDIHYVFVSLHTCTWTSGNSCLHKLSVTVTVTVMCCSIYVCTNVCWTCGAHVLLYLCICVYVIMFVSKELSFVGYVVCWSLCRCMYVCEYVCRLTC